MDVLALRDHAQAQLDAFLDDLRTLVNIDSGTYTPAGVMRVADELHSRLVAAGARVERIDGSEYGPHLVARWQGAGRARVLLVGHMDTVFPDGEAQRRPFHVDGERAYGPGVMDMKSGLLTGLYAARALQTTAPWAELTFLLNSDEEIGSPSSHDLVAKLASASDAVLVLEPNSRVDKVTVARKGVATYRLEVAGVSAHAGVEPHRGRSAIIELAHRILAVQELNDSFAGVTLNVGVAHGGERPNVVPDTAYALIDVRAPDPEGVTAVEAALHRIADAAPVVEGTITTLSGRFMHQPFTQSKASIRLFTVASEVATELGNSLSGGVTGGGSDGNTAAAVGAPTLDGLGPAGGLAHNPGEFIMLDSIAPRIALLAGIIARLDGNLPFDR